MPLPNQKPKRDPSPIYIARIWQLGNSVVFPLGKLLRDAIGARINQKVLIRVHPPYVTFRLVDPDELIPVGGFTTGELPPVWPRSDANA